MIDRFIHDAWLDRLQELQEDGNVVAPRGQRTYEQLAQTLAIDSHHNLLDVPDRNLNFRFAVAEWLWMTFGLSAVEPLARYNSVMRQFSDDGVSLTGAYGPHLRGQLARTLRRLRDDPDTRQAVIEISRPHDERTKDEPCTLSLQFLTRRDGASAPMRLHLVATMRSSDAWLGIPYDVYSFTQFQNCVAGVLGVRRGNLVLQMGSSHLYDRDKDRANTCLINEARAATLESPSLPGLPPAWLEDVLLTGRLPERPLLPNDPWNRYAYVLTCKSSADARAILAATDDV